MSPLDNFLRYLGVTGATIIGLFAVQYWGYTMLDLHFNEERAEAPANTALVKRRQQASQALEQAGIKQAMAQVAQSRSASPLITPRASDDLSAMSGWVQRPDFAPYEPQVVAPATAAPTSEGAK